MSSPIILRYINIYILKIIIISDPPPFKIFYALKIKPFCALLLPEKNNYNKL